MPPCLAAPSTAWSKRLPCNLLVARVGELANCKRILLAVRGGPYAEFALQIADRLALPLR